jgi:hypothetical protein
LLPKLRLEREYLRLDVYPLPGSDAPHVLYANLDFEKPDVERRARRLLKWLELTAPAYAWPPERTLAFLKAHQDEFRQCLRWLSEGAIVDFGQEGKSANEFEEKCELNENWRAKVPLRFLQLHGLEHGGVELVPRFYEDAYFKGLTAAQKTARDPLDPIAWYLLGLLSNFGTVFVRQCRRIECGQFFSAKTVRRLYHDDSCRAMHHQMGERVDAEVRANFKKDKKGRYVDEFHQRQRAYAKITRQSRKELERKKRAAQRLYALKKLKAADQRLGSKGLAPLLDPAGTHLRK